MAISITALDAAINALVADLDKGIDYSVGDKSVSNSQKLQQLMALRESLASIPEVELEMMTFDFSIALSGHDDTQTSVPL